MIVHSDKHNTTLVVWIPGLNDTFYHQHIFQHGAFKGCDILLLHFNDYTPYTTSHPAPSHHLPTAETPYNSEDFYEHFPQIDRLLHPYLDGDPLRSKYSKYILYGHSTGGLIASVYCANGKYANFFSGLILNDPFLDFNEAWYVEWFSRYAYILPQTNHLGISGLRFNKNTKMTSGGPSKPKQLIADAGWDVNEALKTSPPTTAGFILASAKFHHIVQSSTHSLTHIPVLLLIANDTSHTMLNSSETRMYGSNISSNTTTVMCKNCHHDVFFPIKNGVQQDPDTLREISIHIDTFVLFIGSYNPTLTVLTDPPPQPSTWHGQLTPLNLIILILSLLLSLLAIYVSRIVRRHTPRQASVHQTVLI